jgi:hypothetical protein
MITMISRMSPMRPPGHMCIHLPDGSLRLLFPPIPFRNTAPASGGG